MLVPVGALLAASKPPRAATQPAVAVAAAAAEPTPPASKQNTPSATPNPTPNKPLKKRSVDRTADSGRASHPPLTPLPAHSCLLLRLVVYPHTLAASSSLAWPLVP